MNEEFFFFPSVKNSTQYLQPHKNWLSDNNLLVLLKHKPDNITPLPDSAEVHRSWARLYVCCSLYLECSHQPSLLLLLTSELSSVTASSGNWPLTSLTRLDLFMRTARYNCKLFGWAWPWMDCTLCCCWYSHPGCLLHAQCYISPGFLAGSLTSWTLQSSGVNRQLSNVRMHMNATVPCKELTENWTRDWS